MLETPFHFSSVRKTTGAFGRLFADIKLERQSGQAIKVPLIYGNKRAWFTRLKQIGDGSNPYQGHSIATLLPRMSFFITGIFYDSARQLNPTNIVRGKDPAVEQLIRQFQPVPYDINYELAIAVKNTDDGLRIVEQIVPNFRPQVSITIKDIPQLNITRDVPVLLQDVSMEDNYDADPGQSQSIIWTLTFLVKTHLYPPIKNAEVIKKVNAYIYQMDPDNYLETNKTYVDPTTANEWDVDSNGEPTFEIVQKIEMDSNG